MEQDLLAAVITSRWIGKRLKLMSYYGKLRRRSSGTRSMIERRKLLDGMREAPLHWLLLVALWVFMGCMVECDPDEDPNCEPAVDNPNPATDPATAGQHVSNACPGPAGCFDPGFWPEFVNIEEICDVKTIDLEDGEDVLHCAVGTDAATGDITLWCWLGSTGEKVLERVLNDDPPAGCGDAKLAPTDINVDGLPDICVTIGETVVCVPRLPDAGKPDFGAHWTVGEFEGTPLDLEGGMGSDPDFGALQLVTASKIYHWIFGDPDYDSSDGILAPTGTTDAPGALVFEDGTVGDFLQNENPDFAVLFTEGAAETGGAIFYFTSLTFTGAIGCGGDFLQVALPVRIQSWSHLPGVPDGVIIHGTDELGNPVALFAQGSVGNGGSVCPDGWGVGNDLLVAYPIDDEIVDLVASAPSEAGETSVYTAFADENKLDIRTILSGGSPLSSPTGLDSPAATPQSVPDPLGPYPLGGSPKHIVLGRDVNLDGKPEVLTVNSVPRNYSLVFSSVNNTEPNPIRLDGRVIADEPWLNNENAMPIGLISDLMVVGIPKDTEGAGTSTGAVWSFKRRGGRWVQHQKIIPENPQSGMRFGYSLSVEEQIDTGEAWLAVGSRTWNSFEGRVDLYQRSGDDWVYHQTLENGENDFFGWDVDVNVDIPVGQEDPEWTVAIGAPSYRFDGRSSNTGAVFVSFMGSGSSFFTGPALPVNSESVTANNPGVGRSVAIDGDVIIAGAPGLRVDDNNGAGGVYIYRRGAFTPWALSSEILNPNPATGEINGANFGFSVDVVKQVVYPRVPTGNYYYLIGAPRNTSLYQGGEAYIFGGGNSGYQRFRRPGGGDPNDKFGHAVAFRDDLIGGNHLFLVSTNFLKTGGAYLYDQPDFPDPWRPINTIDIPNREEAPANTAVIGEAVAAWDDWVAVSTSNLSTGNDAVYTDLVPIMISGFEAEED